MSSNLQRPNFGNDEPYIQLILSWSKDNGSNVYRIHKVRKSQQVKALNNYFQGQSRLYIYQECILDEGKTFEECGIENGSLLICPPKSVFEDQNLLRLNINQSSSSAILDKGNEHLEGIKKANIFGIQDLRLARMENHFKLCLRFYKSFYEKISNSTTNNPYYIPPKNESKLIFSDKLDQPSVDPLPPLWEDETPNSNLCSCY